MKESNSPESFTICIVSDKYVDACYWAVHVRRGFLSPLQEHEVISRPARVTERVWDSVKGGGGILIAYGCFATPSISINCESVNAGCTALWPPSFIDSVPS